MNSHAKPRSREEKAKNPGNFLLLNSSATSREKQTSIHLTTNNFDQGTKSPMNIEELSAVVVDCAYKLHVEAGPARSREEKAKNPGNRGQCAFPFIFVLRDFVWSD